MSETSSAGARAEAAGPVWGRIPDYEPVPARPPLGLLSEARRRGLAPTFYWHDRSEAHIGLGEVDRVEAAGPHRLHEVERRLRERLALDPDASRRWFGGFSFEPTVEGGFSGFGAARFVRPRFLWSLDLSTLRATLTPGDRTSPLDWSRVLEWARAPALVPTPLEGGATVDAGSFERWSEVMARAQAALGRGELRKVVLSRDVVVERKEPIDPARVLAGLPARSSAEAAFAFFSGASCFVGLTPERLVRLEGGRIKTEALAGSSLPDDPEGRRLLESLKDREEHRYVVEHLRARLAELAEIVEVPDGPTVRHLGHLSHLCTAIEARGLRTSSLLAVADALHPTPAVGGVPIETARGVIEAAESRPRGWYAGAVGWLEPEREGPGRGELRVALRSALLKDKVARIFVGAGIVPGSTVEGEWKETAVKASRMLHALGER